MLLAAVAQVEDPDTAAAVAELIPLGRARWPGAAPPPSVAVIFAGIHVDHAALLAAVAQAWPEAQVIGCTTDGEAGSPDGFAEDSIVLTLLGSDGGHPDPAPGGAGGAGGGVGMGVGLGRGLRENPKEAAAEAVRQACEAAGVPTRPLRGVVALADSLTASGAGVVDGLQEAAGRGTPVLGATAGDQLQFRGTYQFFGRQVLQDAVVVLVLAGPVTVAHGVASGWHPVGPAVEVTEAAHNVVSRLGDRTALAFYQEYIGPRDPLGEHALSVLEEGDEVPYLRAPLAVDRDTGAITFTGDVPVGARARLTQFTRAAVLDACASSIETAQRRLRQALPGARPALAWFFSCAGRKEVLGTWSGREYDLVRAAVGPEVPVAGFYAYGEIAPCAAGAAARFHAETFVTLLLGTPR